MFLDARAHYINGVGYYERDSVVEACQEYLKALEVMEERFEEKEMVGEKAQFMALTYTRLTKNYSDLYLHEQAIYFGKKARKYYNKYEAQVWHLAWLFDEIGSNYNVTNNLDSAMAYFNKGIEMLPDSNNLAYRDLRVHIVFLSYVINKNRDAVLNQLRNLLRKSDSEKEYLSRCLTLGEVYFHEQQYDSAYLYLTKVYYSSKSVNAKKQAAEWLVDICKTQDKEDETVMYTDFLVPFATQDENKSFVKSQLAELYNGYKQYELVHQHRQIIKKQTRWGIALTSGLLVVILALFVLYRKYKKKKQNLEIQIKEEKYAHRIRQKALSGRLKRSNATIKEYGNKISPSIPQQNSIAEKFEDEPICQYILSLCNATQNPIKSTVPVSAYTSIALNDAQKAKLKNAAIMHFGTLFEILKIQHPQLKEKDFQYFYLCLLGLDNVQISVLLQNSLSTTWERENRLKKILGSEDRVAITLHGYIETS
jgi:tetratricopeptide (TPR) repeat protein